MDKATRSAIERATQQARKLLDEDFSSQLEGTFDVLRSGVITAEGGVHLTPRQRFQRGKIVAAIEHKKAAGTTAAEAVTEYVRDAAFTTLNRFVALKMLEARQLVQECITKGEQSAGYREFCGMAPGLALLPGGAGYRLYVESLFDEFSTEIKVLFDRRDAASVLWPKRQTFEALLNVLNAADLTSVWAEDETIGWVYQFFNSGEERRQMRDESQSPRNSRELAVRNQFFTPRYVVQFLVDNTLGRMWLEMHGEDTALVKLCEYLVRGEEKAEQPRPRKDPRDFRILDPACGSGHFLLYSFDLLMTIYEEAWGLAEGVAPASEATGRSLKSDYPDIADLRRAAPGLVVEHNLHGVDIDARCAQIAALALWLRAQRAWKDSGVAASDRHRITRTHIVAAEPMPVDPDLIEEFATRLNPPLLGSLFKKMVGETRLAGELGTLLRLETGIAAELRLAREQFVKQRQTTGFLPGIEPIGNRASLDLSGIDDDQFFHNAEFRIIEALREFAETATGAANVRRRLFADDASQGVALIDLVRTQFDIVLMNPPFGAPTISTKTYVDDNYPKSKADLYAACVDRGIDFIGPTGMIGAITSRTGLFLKSFETWRRDLLLDSTYPIVLADFGGGVLDGAMVETACFVLQRQCPKNSVFIKLDDESEIEIALAGAVGDINTSSSNDRVSFVHAPDFRKFPESRWLYWIGPAIRRAFVSLPSLKTTGFIAAAGLQTNDDFRFVRAAWEVSPSTIGRNRRWAHFYKGGEFSPFFDDLHLLVLWQDGGHEIKQHTITLGNSPSRHVVNEQLYFHSGLGYINISSVGFSAQILPADVVFSIQGQFLGGQPEAPPLSLMGSSAVSSFLDIINPGRHYQAGQVQLLPIPTADLKSTEPVAKRIAKLKRSQASWCEESRYFVEPALLSFGGTIGQRTHSLGEFLSEMVTEIRNLRGKIDADVSHAYGLDEHAQIYVANSTREAQQHPGAFFVSSLHHLLAQDAIGGWAASSALLYAFGIAMGRWRAVKGVRSDDGELSNAIPDFPPALQVIPTSEASSDILVDDEGHRDDVYARVVDAVGRSFQSDGADTALELVKLASEGKATNLRDWIARELFSYNLRIYTKSRRKAPIYWQIATPTSSYSVWLYLHRLSEDSLYRVQNEYVAPKLAHEERRLTSIRAEIGGSPNSAQRKQLSAHQVLVEELRTLLEEVKRVAPLWKPHLDDGVLINFAPLWRLVPQHKSWQRELKATWDSLCAGHYDWSHLAIHLWPERVIPKCASDRSIAVAHGLESVFWALGDDGKWKSRASSERSVEELVRERTSVAVKSALQGLIEAPTAVASKTNKRRSQ